MRKGFTLIELLVVLGIIGLRARAKNPAIKGSVHAWIGIVLGGLFTLLWATLLVLMFIGAALNNGR